MIGSQSHNPALSHLLAPLPSGAAADQVLLRLHRLATRFEQIPKLRIHLAFLEAYRRSTRALLRSRPDAASAACNPLRGLVPGFADRYLAAMGCALLDGAPRSPWRAYFAYTQNGGRNALLALLLGVKAHVSGDLPHCLAATTCSERTFFEYDRVLQALTQDVVVYARSLSGRRSARILTHSGLLSRGYAVTVARWRRQVWRQRQDAPEAPATEAPCWRMIALFDPLWWSRHRLWA